MNEEFIPYGSQWIDEQDIEVVTETLKSDYLTTGPKIKEFEDKFADYVDAKYAVVIANGTAALHAATYAAGIKEGDEVITTPITFAATANSVLYQDAIPVFADIDPKTYNIDPESIKENITDKTKAIIPVHYTGQPCEMDKIKEIAAKNDLIIIEDGAHAVGATYKEQKIGSIGDMTTFSFHPVKNMTTGEGGMITTDSKELYDKLLKFRTHGITKNHSDYINKSHGPWYHEQQELGYNYRITDIQAALGITQLGKLDIFLARRREIVNRYNNEFKDIEGLIIPEQLEKTNSAWHIYVLQLELEKLTAYRKEIFKALRDKNLGVNVHYIPVYFHPYYQSLGYEKGICPKAEKLYERIITIPLYPKMADQQVDEVIKRIKSTITNYQK
ncbi:UDP-4-amino-4,6-dideoxy-N-acetyl-beta-L-altrosamine transaminase [Halanaerobium saccharolyticum]|uniref:UDP-4-amino-4, 6-dideoxy-N-acetyl-beta-L-altrosamine transaminase n=1 Tax=Halanaerobium saccharolyticum TaxID=43595 RepID=A0A4R7Z7D7_9FIRM|nr:UDP-4-amino-4,6-dideoxy-N-acetyl-beta-L-altrosamine transaminase [Halanaerobium saccharolyticum]RAK12634.1 UDP-4-amino-4,6-dideoxy-N-acetyl-beta-L-altrosamine transaminase [Halanaerobium saccharolyticum]TDW05454.1 UDP-4-amino-4,6-dideoxy-N-acetyl-beta-L-altrosamine transaminase [Halanaerobium saccharolyticum]TDX62969.1 UDP-4-amino-4,6-dideoxy-N-acetyl-beta-L-altrosamine transaminase [Halanaerobium saccharolyticum]